MAPIPQKRANPRRSTSWPETCALRFAARALTGQPCSAYPNDAPANSGAGIGVPQLSRPHRPQNVVRGFFVRAVQHPSYGRLDGGLFGGAGPLGSRYANAVQSPALIGVQVGGLDLIPGSHFMAFTAISPREEKAIKRALNILEQNFSRPDALEFTSVTAAETYARLRLGRLQREEFHAFWLDAKHRLIAAETMFIGSIDRCTVHMREVMKAALAHNAAAVIFAHNHPSGDSTPSQSDIHLTRQLANALKMIDVRLLDHLVVAPMTYFSIASMGICHAAG